MKIITKCIIDIETLQIVEEVFYEHFGSVTECKGSSGGGGGGGSGKVEYPSYMQTIHGKWLNDSGGDVPLTSMVDAMNAAIGNSPWTTASAYDPDSDITNMLAAPDTLQTLVDLLSSGNTLDNVISDILSDTRIDNAVNEFAADLDDRLTSEVLPRFEAGMRDINAVVSTAFVIGRSNIEASQNRQISKYSADLHMKAFSDDAIKVIALKLEYQKQASHLIADANRVKIVAKKEEADTNLNIDVHDALWDLETFQYGANLLSSIGGGVVAPHSPKAPSALQSMIGGALSGASAGALIAGTEAGAFLGHWGMIGGAVLGAASAFL